MNLKKKNTLTGKNNYPPLRQGKYRMDLNGLTHITDQEGDPICGLFTVLLLETESDDICVECTEKLAEKGFLSPLEFDRQVMSPS